tara:strand:+ start:1832 stop:3040 length:1209 start_codon:yes stop_codon:yes gene_type:complete
MAKRKIKRRKAKDRQSEYAIEWSKKQRGLDRAEKLRKGTYLAETRQGTEPPRPDRKKRKSKKQARGRYRPERENPLPERDALLAINDQRLALTDDLLDEVAALISPKKLDTLEGNLRKREGKAVLTVLLILKEHPGVTPEDFTGKALEEPFATVVDTSDWKKWSNAITKGLPKEAQEILVDQFNVLRSNALRRLAENEDDEGPLTRAEDGALQLRDDDDEREAPATEQRDTPARKKKKSRIHEDYQKFIRPRRSPVRAPLSLLEQYPRDIILYALKNGFTQVYISRGLTHEFEPGTFRRRKATSLEIAQRYANHWRGLDQTGKIRGDAKRSRLARQVVLAAEGTNRSRVLHKGKDAPRSTRVERAERPSDEELFAMEFRERANPRRRRKRPSRPSRPKRRRR